MLVLVLNKYQFKNKKNENFSEHELQNGRTMNIQVLSQPANGHKLKIRDIYYRQYMYMYYLHVHKLPLKMRLYFIDFMHSCQNYM